MQDHSNTARHYVDALLGTGVFFTSMVVDIISTVSFIASAIASVTGAIVGVYGLYRIVRDILAKR